MQRFQVSPAVGHSGKTVPVGSAQLLQYLLMGRLSEVGPSRKVCLDTGKEHVVAIVGKRGSGKTHTLGVIVEGLAVPDPSETLGVNDCQRAVLVFDTLNLFQWMNIPLESARGVEAERQFAAAKSWNLPFVRTEAKLWHLAGLDPVSAGSTAFLVQVSDMSAQDWGLLMDVDTTSEPMGQLLSAVTDKVRRTGWDSARSHQQPIENHSIDDMVRCISEDVEIGTEYTPDTRRAVKQRLSSYRHLGLFSRAGTSLKQLLKPGQVSVLLLGQVQEDLRTLVTFLLMRRLRELRFESSQLVKDAMIRGSAEIVPEIPKTWVIIDEAQNIIPSRTASIATAELARFIREGRNYGLSMAISTQQPQAIDPKVMSQVDVLVVHTLTVQGDINYVIGNLKSLAPQTITLGRNRIDLKEAIRQLDIGQCMISSVESPRTIFAEIRPRITTHGGFEA